MRGALKIALLFAAAVTFSAVMAVSTDMLAPLPHDWNCAAPAKSAGTGAPSAVSGWRCRRFDWLLNKSYYLSDLSLDTVPKFQFPSFRVSEAPSSLLGPVWRVTQIPSFRVSEAPSWVRALKAQGTPKFQIPSFRVSEAPSIRTSSEQRDTHIPDSEFPSFRGLLLQGPSQRDPPQIPDSQFPSFRGPRLLGPRSTTNSVPDSECNTDLPCRARGITYVESKFQNTESSFYFRSCTHREPSGALAAPPAVTHLPRAPSFRRPPSSRRGEALWERVIGGDRVGFAGGGLF